MIGVANGEIDHPIYLLPGLHLADPSFLASDWFVAETAHSHRVYAVLVAALARLGPIEPGLAVAAALQSTAVALATWWLTRHLYDEPLVPWAMALLLVGATHARGVGLSWLIVPQFVAASVAGAATMWGLALLATPRRTALAGLAFGIAALVHVNFAVLLTPVVATAAGAMSYRRQFRRALTIVGIFAVFASPAYARVLQHLGAPGQELAGEIIVQRYPHHFDPTTWGPGQAIALALVVVAGAAAVLLRRPSRHEALFAAVGTIVLMVLASLAIGYSDLSHTVNQLFVWRLSSVVSLLVLVAVAAAVVSPPRLTVRQRRLAAGAAVVAGVGVLAALAADGAVRRLGVATAVVLFVAWRSGWLSASPRAVETGRPAGDRRRVALIAVLAGFVPLAWLGLADSHIEFRVHPESRAALYRWARDSTPENALFAVPPGWADFRLVAHRAMVAHKSPPIEAADLFEWVDRLEALTGLPPQADYAHLDSAFLQAECGRIADLTQRYAIDYAVRPASSPPCGHVVFSEGEFEVVVPASGPELVPSDRSPAP